ncbi:MAG: copper resistance protein [Alphaproteobacteria bacterium]|nr:copper resistance protein [Alphaproteobacteria bacterium]
MAITLSRDKVKAGPVEFEVTNTSTDLMHEFLIAPWKGKITSLPYDAKAKAVAEDKLPRLEGVEDMKAGAKATIRLVLAPGDYVVFCNQPGHYKMGMERRFTVTK